MENHSRGLRTIPSEIKIGLIGYGKMGRIIERIAADMGCSITGIVDPEHHHSSICEESVGNADVLIDFSHPSVALDNIQRAISIKKNIVVGTTGWYDRIGEVQQWVADGQIGMLYSPNFSLGIHLFLNMVSHAAKLINHFEEYDIAALEMHHNKKIDIPSGTALAVGDTLLKGIHRKEQVIYGANNYCNQKEQIHFPSVRCGNTPGTHEVIFDSPADTITLKHEARNREGFARGAINAAAWLRKKNGLFTLDDMLENI